MTSFGDELDKLAEEIERREAQREAAGLSEPQWNMLLRAVHNPDGKSALHGEGHAATAEALAERGLGIYAPGGSDFFISEAGRELVEED